MRNYLKELGYSDQNIEDLLSSKALKSYTEETLFDNIKRNYKYLNEELKYSNEEIKK